MSLRPLFLRALKDPALLAAQPAAHWQHLLALGRVHGVSGRWHRQLQTLGVLDAVPARVRHHLWADHVVAADHARRVQWEIDRLHRALDPLEIPWALLKGAAYIAAQLPPAQGRLVADVDVLVPHQALSVVECQLRLHGWQMPPQTPYDAHYYRAWMHELPPLHHELRGGTLDVHHTLLPLTDPLHPDGDALLARRVSAGAGAAMLAPPDLVLHSVLHGFRSGEFQHGLRDVLDVYELVSHFSATDGAAFWASLLERCLSLRVARPLRLALGQAEAHLGLCVPPAFKRALRRADVRLPPVALTAALINRVLVPTLPPSPMARLAAQVLRLRSHCLKMPLPRLLPHLAHKLARKLRPDPGAEVELTEIGEPGRG